MTSKLIVQRWRKELTDTDGNPLPFDNSPFSNEWNNHTTINNKADLERAQRDSLDHRYLRHRIVRIDVLTDENGVYVGADNPHKNRLAEIRRMLKPWVYEEVDLNDNGVILELLTDLYGMCNVLTAHVEDSQVFEDTEE